jgi:hypothetical protein
MFVNNEIAIVPIRYKGRQSRMTQQEIEAIIHSVEQVPDITLSELIDRP